MPNLHPGPEVANQLDRILTDPLFLNSQRLGRFLRFTVESALAGSAQELKEYVIGTQVFDRGESYNPQEDPIVRVMAGRVRAKLAEYYQGSGQGDPVLIELPRGGYAPKFSWRTHSANDRAPGALPPSQLVGRDRELGVLRTTLSAVASGAGRMVSISGDAGMGKTTMAEDFLAELEARRTAFTARGRCSERLAETDAFAPVLEALDGLCRGEFGERASQILKAAAPAWYAQIAPSSGESETKGTSSERMRRELAAFLEELARTLPVVLFFDDLHWSDASTCELLGYLGSRMRSMRILVITTHRPGAILTPKHPFLPLKLDLERRGLCHEIPLSLLGKEHIRQYIDLKFPGHGFPDDFAGILHERTQGNPLFLTDLLHFLDDTRVLMEQEGRMILAQTTAEVGRAIPAGTQAMIGVKLDQLGEEDRNILLCGAVQGMQFDSAVVAQVLALDPAVVEERLRELDHVHRLVSVVEEQDRPGLPLSTRYRFVHTFYQNALYASLTPSRRAAQSLEVAGVLSGMAGEAARTIAADLAMLFEAGRDYARATEQYLHAARNAARVFAYPESVILCERGLRSLAALPASRDRDGQELLFSLTLGMALMSTRGYAAPEVERTYGRSRVLCRKLNKMRRLVSVLWAIHACETNAGRLPEALEIGREMREVAEALEHPGAMVESLHALGTTLAFMGRLREARDCLERIFAIVPSGQHEFHGSLFTIDPLVTSLSMLARLLTLMGDLERAMEKALESVEVAGRLAHPHSHAYATFWVGWIYEARGEHSRACEHLEAAMALCRTHGLPLILEWGRVVRGSALCHLGRHAEGTCEIRESIERQGSMGSKLDRAYCLTVLAEALLGQGQAEKAIWLCDEALDSARRTQGRSYEPETRRVRGESILALSGDSRRNEVEAELFGAVRQAHEAECRLLEVRAAVSYFRFRLRYGIAEEARNLLEDVVSSFANGAVSPYVAEGRRLLKD